VVVPGWVHSQAEIVLGQQNATAGVWAAYLAPGGGSDVALGWGPRDFCAIDTYGSGNTSASVVEMRKISERGERPPGKSKEGRLWTVTDVAAFACLSTSKIYHLAEAGLLPCRRLGRRGLGKKPVLRFIPEEVKAWLDAGCPAARPARRACGGAA
jgi:predicted DNA-binding transcriptional regulator AlpA